MKPGLWRYIKAAFNARPLGMFVAPNWVGLGAFGLLGLVNPGFWVLGVGLELAYLYILSQSQRFRAHIDSLSSSKGVDDGRARLEVLLSHLDHESQARWRQLSNRCQQILDTQPEDRAGLDVQAEELGRLLWLYAKLLRTRSMLEGLLREARQKGEDESTLERRAKDLNRSLKEASSDAMRRSIEAQIDILKRRADRQAEAQGKLAHVDTDLERIEQQVELLREETLLTSDASTLSRRIDTASSALTETVQWVKEQEDTTADLDELLGEEPPLLTPLKRRHSDRS
jgi:predicted  nucleic acid-binding Zn-ribbon protein